MSTSTPRISRAPAMAGRCPNPAPYATRAGLGEAFEPQQLVVTLGNTIQNEAAPDALYATVVSVGGWAMASVADVRMGQPDGPGLGAQAGPLAAAEPLASGEIADGRIRRWQSCAARLFRDGQRLLGSGPAWMLVVGWSISAGCPRKRSRRSSR